jgi:hypothetical protein
VTDLVPYRPESRDVVDGWTSVISDVSRLAAMVADTDFVPKALRNKPAAVTACILAGREVDIPPMRALQHLHMVDGRPTMSAELKRAKALAAGHHIVYVETTTSRCVVKGRRADGEEWTTVSWSMDDAKAAKLDGKDNYRKHPRRMLQARATGELCDLLFPDAVGGLATTEQVVDEADAPAAATNGHAPPAQKTARRRTAVAAQPVPAAVAPRSVQPTGPPQPPLPGEDEPASEPADDTVDGEVVEPITAPQRARLMAVFGQLGISDRDERLQMSSKIVNRHVNSANELTKDEASALIDTLEQAAAQAEPFEWLAQIIVSTTDAEQ